ncbi:MFS general substrate transporter [Chiua virens]|nr:MFS general substrate transporter [Chiua virens]
MKLPFGRKNDARPVGRSGSQEAPAKSGICKSFDWKLMLALLFPVTLETLDYTVISFKEQRNRSHSLFANAGYIGTAYLLASTVFLPLFASIADIYGRHFGLQLSFLFFLAGSAISTGAVNMPMILIGRGIAGIGAAGLLTIVRTIMSDTVSLNQNNFQQSALFLLYSVGFSVGPVIGGFLVVANFRWVFAINLPCTVLGMLLCFVLLRKRSLVPDQEKLEAGSPSKSRHDAAMATLDSWVAKLILIDWIGTFLFVSGGILILLALNWGPDDGWKTVRVIVNLILGAILIVLCILWEILLGKRSSLLSPERNSDSDYVQTKSKGVFHARPMLPIELFTSYDMLVTQYGAFTSGIVMFVMFYFVAIFATVVTGLPPSQAGIQLLYFAPGLGGGSLLSIRLIKRFRQPKYPIVLGGVIMTVGVGLIQMAMQNNVQKEVNGFMAMARSRSMHASPKPNHIAITNAMLNFFRTLGGTVGLAQCFTILDARAKSYISSQLAYLASTLTPDEYSAVVATLLDNPGGLTSVTSLDGLPTPVQDVVRDAFRDGVRWGFVSLIPWLGVGTVLSVFLSKIKDSDAAAKAKENGEEKSVESVEMVPRHPEGGGEVEGAAG